MEPLQSFLDPNQQTTQAFSMGHSLRDTFSPRPRTRNGDRERPTTRDHGEHSLMIPSRTSSLHSRITQPIPSALNIKPNQRTPKTLTHAYMVCGVGREPSQWVKAPPPAQGKVGHMKSAIGQFWMPEILGSSPRVEQDNEIARALHAAMRVGQASTSNILGDEGTNFYRLVSLTMLKFAPAEVNHTAYITPSSFNKIHHIPSTASHCGYGREQTKSVLKRYVTYEEKQSPTTMSLRTKHTGFHTV